MMENKIEIFKAIATQLEQQIQEEKCELILKTFKSISEHEVTVEVIKKTSIGKVIGKLRKHTNQEISSESERLINQWKRIVESGKRVSLIQDKEEPTLKRRKQKVDVEDEAASSKKIRTEPKKKETETNFIPKSNREEKKPSSSSEGTPSKNLNEKRKNATIMLSERLGGEKQQEDEFEPTVIAEKIEQELFQKFGDCQGQPYKSKLLSLCFNLKQNTELRDSLMKGFISVSQLCSMTTQEMASDALKERRKSTEAYFLEASKASKPATLQSTMFKCGKCRSNNTNFFQLQTRSADEPMTTFHNCNNCNHRWRS